MGGGGMVDDGWWVVVCWIGVSRYVGADGKRWMYRVIWAAYCEPALRFCCC